MHLTRARKMSYIPGWIQHCSDEVKITLSHNDVICSDLFRFKDFHLFVIQVVVDLNLSFVFLLWQGKVCEF